MMIHRAILFAALISAGLAGPARAQGPEGEAVRRTPVVEAVRRVRDAVVNISTEGMVNVRRSLGPFGPGDPFERSFDDFWSGPVVERRKVKSPLGSGSVITPDGLVVTNEHVIRRASTIYLTLDNGERFEAQLLGADPEHDLALLRAKADRPLPAIPMGTSSDLMLGETVVALGNPFGFENSVTSGIISALDREIAIGSGGESVTYKGLIQTSALINPGNSGGPLVNVLGRMIGINAAVVDQAQGIGFAIPIDGARDALAPLLTGPHVSEAWLGFKGETVAGRRGTRVTEVEAAGPAHDLLKTGDVISAIDDGAVRDLFDLNLAVAQHKPGDAISLSVGRDGGPETVQVVVGRLPELSSEELLRRKLGIRGQDLTKSLARSLGVAVDEGVVIADILPDGPAGKIGLIRSDVIIQLGSQPVRNLRDAAAALRETRAGESLIVMIVRQNYRAYAPVTIPR
jgi:serine protease Do